jgi:phosphoesterase RecJ-like protein
MNRKKLIYEDQLQAARSFIRDYDDFLVVSHVSPDGDAISSTTAVGWMLERLNKRYIMVNEDRISDKFGYLWNSGQISRYAADMETPAFQNVISVDCADFSRIGKVSEWFGEGVSLLNIDHHPTNDDYGTLQLIKPDAAATVEILYDLAKVLDLEWNADLATCIYSGLLTDTGGFRYSSTSPKVMKIASEMLGYGVKGSDLADLLLEKITYSHIRLLQTALASLSFSTDRRIAWVSATAEEIAQAEASNDDLEGLVNYPRNIEGVEVGILFKQPEPGRIKASLRSAGTVNVAEIACLFGGGGHVRASGCTLEGTLEDAIGRVVAEVGKALA